MADFEERFNYALENVKYSPHGDSKVYAKSVVKSQFRESVFIYGTVGPSALHSGGRGNPVARAAAHWVRNTQQHKPRSMIAQRTFNFYDAGPRTAELIKGGHQMMDMYYGMNNNLFRNRKINIAEFVHLAMEFDQKGRKPKFDPNVSGRDAFMEAFPGAGEGWMKHNDTTAAYGHSATKEMSKLIREGIKRFGGKLIFEGKSVFGAGVFDPNAYQGDTDLEAQELFKSFRFPVTPRVPFGEGTLEFQWSGIPTTPTRAHFLTNWSYAGAKVHSLVNRAAPGAPKDQWKNFVEKVLSDQHGLRAIWNNFQNFPPGMIVDNPAMVDRLKLQSNFSKMEIVIAQLSTMLALQHGGAPK